MGISCGAIGGANGLDFRTYWFPSGTKSSLDDTSTPFDLYASANDASQVSDDFPGLTHWYIVASTSTSWTASKFQLKEPVNETSSSWSGKKDYRFRAGDEIIMYKMTEDASNVITWSKTSSWTLNSATSQIQLAALTLLSSATLLSF